MTDIQEQPTLTFDGKTHVIDEISERAKYFVGQLQDLQQQLTATRARLDQLEMSRSGFENLLREELEAPPESEEIIEPPVQ